MIFWTGYIYHLQEGSILDDGDDLGPGDDVLGHQSAVGTAPDMAQAEPERLIASPDENYRFFKRILPEKEADNRWTTGRGLRRWKKK